MEEEEEDGRQLQGGWVWGGYLSDHPTNSSRDTASSVC